ncbi:exported hypothetical protein [Vibrio coralliirubri]|nr:exported hypothetical protein [Vibrio coralliirubri]
MSRIRNKEIPAQMSGGFFLGGVSTGSWACARGFFVGDS